MLYVDLLYMFTFCIKNVTKKTLTDYLYLKQKHILLVGCGEVLQYDNG